MAIGQAQLVDLLTEYRRRNWAGVQTPEWQQKIVRSMAAEGEPRSLRRIADCLSLPRNARILDVGSGVGSFVVACRKRGLHAFGVEPDRIGQGATLTSLQIARQRLDAAIFAAAVGEQLPFAGESFDLVVMDQVLEHVGNQAAVVAEAFRVLKPGGAMYVACPNYLRFYEPHYKIWLGPLMPKPLASLYLRLRGRDPVLLKQITYTTNRRIRALFRGAHVRDLNREDIVAACMASNIPDRSRIGRLIARLAQTKLLGEVVIWAASFYIRLREGGCEFLVRKEA